MFRTENTVLCVSAMCQHGLLFVAVYVPSGHRMLFLPDKCQVLKAILPIPLWRLPNNLLSLAMGSCQGFCIHAHLALPNVGNTGTVQILRSLHWLCTALVAEFYFFSPLFWAGAVHDPYSIIGCAIEFIPYYGAVFQSRNLC